jgi:hypothetical protein
MTKTFDGDEVIVRLPKKRMSEVPLAAEKPQVDKARLERPKFPDNLPLSKYREAAQAGEPPDLVKPDPAESGSDEGAPKFGNRPLT